jgi:flagellar basal body-associated protein FliL
LLRLRDRTGGQSGLASPQIPAKEAYVSLWLIILIIVIVVLLLGGFGYSRR